jgi:hypothetical protein
MIRLSITSSDLASFAKLSGFLGLAVAALTLFLRRDLLSESPFTVAAQVASAAVSVPTFLLLIVQNVSWKHPRLAKLLGRRMVHGLWWGELHSNYVDTNGVRVSKPIEIAFVIRQTFLTLSIKSYTADIPGESILETLHAHPVDGDAKLRYAYEMIRWANSENKAIRGYGDLVLGGGDMELAGDYWTNSPSAGRVFLKLLSRDCEDVRSFSDAQRMKQQQRAGAALLKF